MLVRIVVCINHGVQLLFLLRFGYFDFTLIYLATVFFVATGVDVVDAICILFVLIELKVGCN